MIAFYSSLFNRKETASKCVFVFSAPLHAPLHALLHDHAGVAIPSDNHLPPFDVKVAHRLIRQRSLFVSFYTFVPSLSW